MMKAVKVLAMVTIATLVGVGIAYATSITPEYNLGGFVAGTGTVGEDEAGGIVIGGSSSDSTQEGRLVFRGDGYNDGYGRIVFETGASSNGDDMIIFNDGSDTINYGSGTDHLYFGDGVDRILFGSDDSDDYIHFGEGSDMIYFGKTSAVTGNNWEHYIGYYDVSDDSYEEESTIVAQGPMILLQSYNERNPASSTDDYTGASIEVDEQDANGDHTGDVIITLGAGE